MRERVGREVEGKQQGGRKVRDKRRNIREREEGVNNASLGVRTPA